MMCRIGRTGLTRCVRYTLPHLPFLSGGDLTTCVRPQLVVKTRVSHLVFVVDGRKALVVLASLHIIGDHHSLTNTTLVNNTCVGPWMPHTLKSQGIRSVLSNIGSRYGI